jgi:Glycosyl hydrolase family 9
MQFSGTAAAVSWSDSGTTHRSASSTPQRNYIFKALANRITKMCCSSCPNIPIECGWKNKNLQTPNPHVVTGALVGGPDPQGAFDDTRDNYQQNDVGIDYNAGFQSLVAALVSLHHLGQLPAIAYETTSVYGAYQG